MIKYGIRAGTVSKEKAKAYETEQKLIKSIITKLKNSKPSVLKTKLEVGKAKNLYELLKRTEVKLQDLLPKDVFKKIPDEVVNQIEIIVKFSGYIKKQEKYVKKTSKYEDIDISKISDFSQIKNLSLEARDKLNKIKPLTLGQAQRIQGINLIDIIAVKMFVEKTNQEKATK
jgi:tRNA uridine 5-carboxymethylaminomethyl modification enzyme